MDPFGRCRQMWFAERLLRDDGSGMLPEDFELRWRTLSYDRLASQGSNAEFPPGTVAPPRRAFGRNGVGRFAAFCFGERYTVRTARNGRFAEYSVSRGNAVPLEFIRTGEGDEPKSGTMIKVGAVRTKLSAQDARAELALRFLVDPLFEVFVNNEKVVFHNIPQLHVRRDTLVIGDLGTIEVITIDSGASDKTTQLHGVAFHVAGRLVGECSWSWLADKSWIDGRTSEAKRFTFIVLADELQPYVVADWSGFKPGAPADGAIAAVKLFVKERFLEATKEKREETIAKVTEENKEKVDKLPPLAKEKWNAFVDQAQKACPSISTAELSSLGEVLANLELAETKYSLLEQLKALKPGELDALNRILEDWTFRAAKAVLDELQKRLVLVEDLKTKISSNATDEVHELQPLFRQGLWIIGPEFETIDFTSNEGMTSVIQKLFEKDVKGSLNRPDFAVLPDGSVGLYDYPTYDSDGGETGVDRLVIVELKKPGVSIGDEQKSQAWKYVRELLEKGLINSRTRVTCFVLGSQVSPSDSGKRTELDGRIEIIPMHFDTVIARAKSRLLKLHDRVANAPFLDKKKMAAFLAPQPAAAAGQAALF